MDTWHTASIQSYVEMPASLPIRTNFNGLQSFASLVPATEQFKIIHYLNFIHNTSTSPLGFHGLF
jgi:hypothetical protein